MKTFFQKNRKLVEIVLTLLLVFLTAGYYYLIYIPARENEIIARRFRTLQRIEKNMQEKTQGYISTIENCLKRADESFFQDIVDAYNKEPEKFKIKVSKTGTITKDSVSKLNHDSLMGALIDSQSFSRTFNPVTNGRKVTITGKWFKLKSDSTIRYAVIEAEIDYREFIAPLLRKNVFDHYLVFNVSRDSSNIVYEDFPSGISFYNSDSLFDAKEKVYTSRIIKIETGGEKYMAFLHPCGYNRKNERIIAGLVKAESFNNEKQQLPEKMVTTILFIAIFTFLLLPVIRLALLGKKERIRLFDLYAVYFSFLLLVPVIILVCFWNKQRFISRASCTNDSKKVLATQISNSLLKEMDAAYTLLDKVDALHASDDSVLIKIDTFNIRYLHASRNRTPEVHDLSDTCKRCNTCKECSNYNKCDSCKKRKTDFDNAIAKLVSLLPKANERYRNTQSVFWMDSAGREIANWAFDEDPPRGVYKEREYFINATNNNDNIFLGEHTHFAIQPLVSRTDGKFKFVIAKKSQKEGLIAASASVFSSVINPVLPLGFGFSITDAFGNTIFDSDATHNLNENLLEEFTDPEQFKAALYTRTSQEFKTRYEDDEATVLVQPILKIPYFIVVTEDGSFESSLNTQCFSFTMVMLFSFFLFLCVELMLLVNCFSRKTKLLKNKFDLSWIFPHESVAHKYYFLFLFNLCLFFLLAIFCFVRFSIERITEYIFLFVIAALLSSIAACVYKEANRYGVITREQLQSKNKMAIKVLIVLSGFISLISLLYSGFIFLSVLLFWVTASLLFVLLHKVTVNNKNSNYQVNFRRMVFSKILLTSAVPVAIFYMCIYDFELRLQQRYKLLDYAEKIEQRSNSPEDVQSIISQINSNEVHKAFYTDAGWIAGVDIASKYSPLKNDTYSDVDSVAINLLKTSRLRYNEVSGITEKFDLIQPFADSQFAFNSIFNHGFNTLGYNITKVLGNIPQKQRISLSSSLLNFWITPCNIPQWIIFLLMLLIALLFCYQILRYVTIKLFGADIHAMEDFNVLHDNLIKGRDVRCLFVQGIPGINKAALIKQQLGKNTIILDFNEIPAENDTATVKENWNNKIAVLEKSGIDCIVFAHLEYDMLNDYANRIKLQLIEKYVFNSDKKIIITSGINPGQFTNSMIKNQASLSERTDSKSGSKKPAKDPFDQQVSSPVLQENIYRWNNLLGGFTFINIDDNKQPFSEGDIAKGLSCVPGSELNHPVFLHKYIEPFKLINTQDKPEEHILLIQSLSEQAYRQVWASLTHEEQIILFDLAEDGLVNTSNLIPLTNLLNKGLIKKEDGVLLLMNWSFRNFVLSIVNTSEIKSIEKEIEDGQSWEDFKYPVLIILGALVYFVLSSNPEKFGNVLPIVSGVMAGIPTVIKLLSYLKPSENKS